MSLEFSTMNKSPDDFETEYDWLTHCAENGFTESMMKLSIKILINRTDEKRILEAYKWIFLARFLGNPKSDEIINLLYPNLSESQIEEADTLVTSWACLKQTEFNLNKTEDWDENLLAMWIQTHTCSTKH